MFTFSTQLDQDQDFMCGYLIFWVLICCFSLADGCATSLPKFKALLNHAPSRNLPGAAQREKTVFNPKLASFSPLLLPRATHYPPQGRRGLHPSHRHRPASRPCLSHGLACTSKCCSLPNCAYGVMEKSLLPF